MPYVRDFAQFFSELSKHVYIKYTKIKAHSGDPMNTLADQLAKGK
ncbi:MAG: hypothetical protein LBO82_01720 [Synergistaceae bacterium]|nr:hypothetical protein [Synergistaceae bacterium]